MPLFFSPSGRFLLSSLLACLLCSCATVAPVKKTAATASSPLAVANQAAHDTFRSTKGWKRKTFRDDAVMKLAKTGSLHIRISVPDQRGLLFVNELIGMDFAVSTGRKGHLSPIGDFKVLGKELQHHSNLYGKITDATGAVVVENADATKNIPAEGQTFEGASMPNFMRLTNDGVGMHIGIVPGYPASHGCIRLPRQPALDLYELLPIGTPVTITDQPEAAPAPSAEPAKTKTVAAQKKK